MGWGTGRGDQAKMPYPYWLGECMFIKDLHCPHYFEMHTTRWVCSTMCEKLDEKEKGRQSE